MIEVKSTEGSNTHFAYDHVKINQAGNIKQGITVVLDLSSNTAHMHATTVKWNVTLARCQWRGNHFLIGSREQNRHRRRHSERCQPCPLWWQCDCGRCRSVWPVWKTSRLRDCAGTRSWPFCPCYHWRTDAHCLGHTGTWSEICVLQHGSQLVIYVYKLCIQLSDNWIHQSNIQLEISLKIQLLIIYKCMPYIVTHTKHEVCYHWI